MTHAEKEVDELMAELKEFGLTNAQAMYATFKIIQARLSEATLNAPSGHRPIYWGRSMDYFSKLVNKESDEAVHTSTR